MNFIDMLFPGFCPVCGKRLPKYGVCQSCRSELSKCSGVHSKSISVGTNTYKIYYLYPYKPDIIKKYIFALKRTASGQLFEFAAEDIAKNLLCTLEHGSYKICNVPRKRLNVRKYGYDHAEKVCKRLEKYCLQPEISFCKILTRRGFSREQKYLDAYQRNKNVSGKFRVRKKCGAGKIILFDDVITTGSTFISCAEEIKRVYGKDTEIIGMFICSN